MFLQALFSRSLVVATTLIIITSQAVAKVDSMSLERAKQSGANRYSEISLKCENESEARFIRKPSSHFALWCSVGVSGLCNTSKFSLARTICKYDTEEYQALANKNSSDKVKTTNQSQKRENTKTELAREQILIEEQRIQIEQKRLQLVQRELVLRRNLGALASIN